MTALLIVFATGEGQTGRVADFLASHFQALGLCTSVLPVEKVPDDIDLESYAGIVVAASIHRAQHQQAIQAFVRRHGGGLGQRHAAFLSVSLSAAGGTEDRAMARQMAEDFLAATGWHPRYVHLVAGAFRYTRYGWLKRRILRRIAELKGAPTDTSRDHELTDWEDLQRFARRFAATL
jgi:menaquinone-dependent protoporphyrinogen oxidase